MLLHGSAWSLEHNGAREALLVLLSLLSSPLTTFCFFSPQPGPVQTGINVFSP